MSKPESRFALVLLALLLALPAGSAGCGRGSARGRAADPAEDRPADGRGSAGHDDHDDQGHHDDHGDETIVELSPEAVARIGLTTTAATRRALRTRRATTGRIGFDEERLAHVGSRVSGRLYRVPGQLGESVAAGETLAVVDSVELGEAKAAFFRARARFAVAERGFERQRSLHAAGLASEQEVLEAEASAEEAAADLAVAREALRLLGLRDDEVDRLSLGGPGASLVSVRAPFAGRVVARDATPGELVTPEDTLFTIGDLSEVWLWVDLYERDLAHVAVRERVTVRLDAWPAEIFPGELAYVADELDPHSQTVRARVDLPNPRGRLRPGMFARVELTGAGAEQGDEVLAIPRTAVQRDGRESIVFARVGPGRFERREVALGRTTDEWVEVVSGLAAGEEVVTEGAFILRSQASADELGGHHH